MDEVGIDVDTLDVPRWKKSANCPGTPLAYAHKATTPAGLEAVWYLLEKGADPHIENCNGRTALQYARAGCRGHREPFWEFLGTVERFQSSKG